MMKLLKIRYRVLVMAGVILAMYGLVVYRLWSEQLRRGVEYTRMTCTFAQTPDR